MDRLTERQLETIRRLQMQAATAVKRESSGWSEAYGRDVGLLLDELEATKKECDWLHRQTAKAKEKPEEAKRLAHETYPPPEAQDEQDESGATGETHAAPAAD